MCTRKKFFVDDQNIGSQARNDYKFRVTFKKSGDGFRSYSILAD